MFVYTLNALLWNIVHRYMLKILNVDTIKKPSLRSEGLSGAYGTRTRKCPQFDFQIVTTTIYLFCNEYVTNI